MIYRQFPDLQWLKEQSESRFDSRKAYDGTPLKHAGWPTVILNVQAKTTYRDNIRGPLSLFCNLSGESLVSVNGKSGMIREGFFFLTNHDQHYTLEINQPKPCETFNIHFGEYFMSQVLNACIHSDEMLLENPASSERQIFFHNRVQRRNAEIDDIICDIHRENFNSMQLEEKLYELSVALLVEEKHLRQSQQRLPVCKLSTREEILKRLLMATDYIHSFYDRELSLEEISIAACLSKFHFLRLFKVVFRQTPYQFINAVRVERAKDLLLHSRFEIQQVARATGFRNASSFSRMFFQQTGMYPTTFRNSQ